MKNKVPTFWFTTAFGGEIGVHPDNIREFRNNTLYLEDGTSWELAEGWNRAFTNEFYLS